MHSCTWRAARNGASDTAPRFLRILRQLRASVPLGPGTACAGGIAGARLSAPRARPPSLGEPLGFDSVWSVKHHFTDYTMCPDVLQFLTYMAGRTTRVALGSMVVVLPWHDPLRVAEQISMLDNISGGRMILGLGRGACKVEFEGLRVPMDESRERFVEYARMLLEGLEKGYCEFDGRFVSQPRADIRPAPFKSFRGRTYAAAVSPESVKIMAELGVGILIIPQKPWPEVADR